MINLQMLILNKCFQCFIVLLKKHAQQCHPQFLWQGRHFGTCESLGSSPVNVQGVPQPFNLLQFFLLPPKRLTRSKLLKCAFT